MGYLRSTENPSTGGLFSFPVFSLLQFCVAVRCHGRSSPAPNPGDVSTEGAAEVDRSRLQTQLGDRGPEFKLVALAVALVATVAVDRYVDGEVPGAAGCGRVQGTGSVPLIA